MLKKDPAALGPRDKVTLRQFQEVWAALGLAVTWQMAAALFNKHGQDAKGLLPAMVGGRCCGRLHVGFGFLLSGQKPALSRQLPSHMACAVHMDTCRVDNR